MTPPAPAGGPASDWQRGSVLSRHRGWVRGVAFSPVPGPAVLASGADDGTVRIWTADGSGFVPGSPVDAEAGPVLDVAFQPPGGTLVASAHADGSVRLWSPADGAPAGIVATHAGTVRGVAFSPDGSTLASAAEDGVVLLTDLASGDVAWRREGPSKKLSVAFSPDGQLVAVGCSDGTVRLWCPDSGAPRRELNGHRSRVMDAQFSPRGDLIASAEPAGMVRLWRLRDEFLLHEFNGHPGYVYGVAFSPDDELLAAAGWDDQLFGLFDVRSFASLEASGLALTPRSQALAVAVAFSADGRLIASGGMDGQVRIWTRRAASTQLSR